MMDFSPLFETMARRNETWYTLENKYGISSHTLSRLKNNMNTTTDTIEILCDILDCDIDGIVVRIPNPKKSDK